MQAIGPVNLKNNFFDMSLSRVQPNKDNELFSNHVVTEGCGQSQTLVSVQPLPELDLLRSQLIGKAPSEVLSVIKSLFGERLVECWGDRYNLTTKETLSDEEIQLILAFVATRVTDSDVRSFFNRISEMDLSKDNVHKLRSTQQEIDELQNIALHKDFDSLSDKEYLKFLSFFRKELLPNQDKQKVPFPLYWTVDVDLRATFKEDRRFYKRLLCWDRYISPEEYLARRAAYVPLNLGMIVVVPSPSNESPICYLTVWKINEEGFGVTFLQARTCKMQVKLLCRGTVKSDNESVVDNFEQMPAYNKYQRYKADIIKQLERICEQAEGKIVLSIHGHSKGAALGQYFITDLTQKLGDAASSNRHSHLYVIGSLSFDAWNTPGVDANLARRYSVNLSKLINYPATCHLIQSLTYNMIQHDITERLGEVFLGRYRSSNNLNLYVRFYPSKAQWNNLKGHHCYPLLVEEEEEELSPHGHFVEERSIIYHLQQKLVIIEFFINQNISKSVDEVNDGVPQLPTVVEQNSQNRVENKNSYIQALVTNHSSELRGIDKKPQKELRLLQDSIKRKLQLQLQNIQKICGKMNYVLERTIFSQLTLVDQQVMQPIIKFTKERLAGVVNENISGKERFGNGVQLLLVPVYYTVSAFLTFSDAPVAIGNVAKRVFNQVF